MWFSSLELNAQTYLYNFSMGYSTNGVVIMVASLLSYGTAYCLSSIFYFFAVACGAIHALHFGFSVYQNYIR
ncbi:hypothetical protein IscW_ISCW011204 [Ixodes scapularis]|uniref:Uncharacterized protein n=1 Tax=Ixodes scapularis TaxID=6945 RepID=B7Q618_IXOSC|nr:hypothetical protein IscW_ISCW011204 [Ixodes scapularis]|eukprot:XP_002411865.1 hypothetical protein IscW_ISCW011204 [Ixodes scapularis]